MTSLMITTSADPEASGRPDPSTPALTTASPRVRACCSAAVDQSTPTKECPGLSCAATAAAKPSPQPTSTITAGPRIVRSTFVSMRACLRALSGPELSGTAGSS